MTMEEAVYKRLAQHLDQLPGGFLSGDLDIDLRLLQRLFIMEDAELAVHLTLERETASVIAERAHLDAGEAAQRLDEMSSKGLIFSTTTDDGMTVYQAVPMVIGIYEFQVNKMDKALIRDFAYYWRARKTMMAAEKLPQIRTIPINQSIPTQMDVFSYEQVNKLVESQDRFAVAPCICRRSAKMTHRGCDAPEETCLVFGEWADYYIRDGRGRPIDREQVYEILSKADAANLVLQPSNSKEPSFICCCCGCCCGILQGLKTQPKPAEAVASAFIAHYESDDCIGCWVCLERCQMDAFTEGSGQVVFNADRCIGCGLCVSTCPSGALTLVRKLDNDPTDLPASMDRTWRAITQS